MTRALPILEIPMCDWTVGTNLNAKSYQRSDFYLTQYSHHVLANLIFCDKFDALLVSEYFALLHNVSAACIVCKLTLVRGSRLPSTNNVHGAEKGNLKVSLCPKTKLNIIIIRQNICQHHQRKLLSSTISLWGSSYEGKLISRLALWKCGRSNFKTYKSRDHFIKGWLYLLCYICEVFSISWNWHLQNLGTCKTWPAKKCNSVFI